MRMTCQSFLDEVSVPLGSLCDGLSLRDPKILHKELEPLNKP